MHGKEKRGDQLGFLPFLKEQRKPFFLLFVFVAYKWAAKCSIQLRAWAWVIETRVAARMGHFDLNMGLGPCFVPLTFPWIHVWAWIVAIRIWLDSFSFVNWVDDLICFLFIPLHFLFLCFTLLLHSNFNLFHVRLLLIFIMYCYIFQFWFVLRIITF